MSEIKPLRLKRKKSTASKNILCDTEDFIEPSMEELLKIQANGATNSDDESCVESSQRQNTQIFVATKRTKKDRPTEMSSKHPVPRFSGQVASRSISHKPRDPRFDPLCGDFNEVAYQSSYGFVTDLKQNELNQLKKAKKATNDEDRKEQLQSSINRYSQDIKGVEKTVRMRDQIIEWKQAEREKIKNGKQPFFLKKSAVKELSLIDEYHQLQKQGKLDTYMAQRRKQNASKDQRYMPYQRNSTSTTE